MQKLLIMLAVATIPAAAGGCNCCGLGACPCNPCNWFNRGAFCGPTATYAAPVAAPVCPPVAAPVCPPAMTQAVAPAIMPQTFPQQYVMPTQAPYAAPYAAAPYAAPMMAAPAQAAPYAYMEPGCGYVEPGCGYMGNVGYGPAMPMEMGGCSSCEAGGYDPGAVMTPVTPTEQFIDPQPAAE